jgi:hypothetical protein
MELLHTAPSKNRDAVLREGLHYGAQGPKSQATHAKKTNEFLDALCPSHLKARGVSRQDCLYMYLVIHDMVHDIKNGQARPIAEWTGEQDELVVQVTVDPRLAYVSDLDAYDAVAQAVMSNAASGTCRVLGQRYWQRIIPLKALQEYQFDKGIFTKSPKAASVWPKTLQRIEIMVTGDVPAQSLKIL